LTGFSGRYGARAYQGGPAKRDRVPKQAWPALALLLFFVFCPALKTVAETPHPAHGVYREPLRSAQGDSKRSESVRHPLPWGEGQGVRGQFYVAAPRSAPDPTQHIPLQPTVPNSLGVNIHFTDPVPGEMSELAASGVRWIRMDLLWAATEREKGQYDFSEYDRLISALDRYHIRAILILCYGNKLYDNGLAPYTDSGRTAFANWAVAAARHFRGRGIIWEVWNEPNGSFWKPRRNDQNYIKLAFAVGEALKERAPHAVTIGPASALIDLQFLKSCFQAGLLNYWAGVSVHPYRALAPETAVPEYNRLLTLIQTYAPPGKKIPIIAGEWGYPGTWLWPGMSDILQAHLLAREFLTDLASGIPITIWYDWKDDGTDPSNMNDTDGLVGFQVRHDHNPVFAPKPSYFALRTLARTLAGYTFTKRLAVGTAQDFVLLFTRSSRLCLAAWTAAWTPQTIVIPGATGRFRVIAVTSGEEYTLRARHRQLTVRLTDAPEYLLPEKGAGLRGSKLQP
jgi:polysaccharide biosynthesis protein PslG